MMNVKPPGSKWRTHAAFILTSILFILVPILYEFISGKKAEYFYSLIIGILFCSLPYIHRREQVLAWEIAKLKQRLAGEVPQPGLDEEGSNRS